MFLILGSLRGPGVSPPEGLEIIPADPTLDSFDRAFELVDLERQFLNSALVSAIAVPLTVLVGSWAGFALTLLPRTTEEHHRRGSR